MKKKTKYKYLYSLYCMEDAVSYSKNEFDISSLLLFESIYKFDGLYGGVIDLIFLVWDYPEILVLFC